MTTSKSLVILFFVWIFSNTLAFSQDLSPQISKQSGQYYRELTWKIGQRNTRHLSTEMPVTAISMAIDLQSTFEGAYVEIDGQKYTLVLDGHAEDGETHQYSQLIHFDNPISEINIFSGEIEAEFKLLLINGQWSKTAKPEQRQEKMHADCLEPISIDQSVWRDGLAEPNYSRAFTDVAHVIVHHSAGSNSASNYTQVVRDIYIFHTQGRGWSDIGYNYLIAQDGTIFKGRDPGNGDQDNVVGAHFCGGNSYTMGICLLGDYNLTTPSNSTLSSLESLITWKLKKENLDPFGNSAHPLNGSLGNIGGHRDGCATDCPGNNTYGLLEDIRLSTAEALSDCGGNVLVANFSVSDTSIMEGETVAFHDLSVGEPDHYAWTFEGGTPSSSTEASPQVTYSLAGDFTVSLTVSSGNMETSIYKESLIHVAAEKEISIYPNPSRGLSIKVANVVSSEVKEIYFVDNMGKRINIMKPESEGDILAISISQLNQGLYLLYVVFEDRLIKERVLIL